MSAELLERLPRFPVSLVEPGDLPSAPKPSEEGDDEETPEQDKPK